MNVHVCLKTRRFSGDMGVFMAMSQARRGSRRVRSRTAPRHNRGDARPCIQRATAIQSFGNPNSRTISAGMDMGASTRQTCARLSSREARMARTSPRRSSRPIDSTGVRSEDMSRVMTRIFAAPPESAPEKSTPWRMTPSARPLDWLCCELLDFIDSTVPALTLWLAAWAT